MSPWDVYLPIAEISFSGALLVGLGLMVGILGGFFGVGGGWIVTPALNIFGFPMSFAIGTDLATIFGQSIIATAKHRKMGNVDARLGLLSILGSIAGVEAGARAVMALERVGNVGPVIRWIYMALLFGLGGYMAYDQLRAARRAAAGKPAAGGRLSRAVRAIRLPPVISLPASGVPSVSLTVIVAIFAATGFLSGFIGVGGGFILLPALIYLVGVPTGVAVGTSLFCVLMMAGYGSFSYALKGRTEFVAAVVMLFGAAVGAQIGVLATRFVRAQGIRLLFALTILLAGVSVALKQAEQLLGAAWLGPLAGWVVLASAGGMSLLVVVKLVRGAAAERKRPELARP